MTNATLPPELIRSSLSKLIHAHSDLQEAWAMLSMSDHPEMALMLVTAIELMEDMQKEVAVLITRNNNIQR